MFKLYGKAKPQINANEFANSLKDARAPSKNSSGNIRPFCQNKLFNRPQSMMY